MREGIGLFFSVLVVMVYAVFWFACAAAMLLLPIFGCVWLWRHL